MIVDGHLGIEYVEPLDDLFLIREVPAEQRDFEFLAWKTPGQPAVPQQRAVGDIETWSASARMAVSGP